MRLKSCQSLDPFDIVADIQKIEANGSRTSNSNKIKIDLNRLDPHTESLSELSISDEEED